ncbi:MULTISPECIES: DUF397 domain-containing protein [unclassified Streptomyces]|uniref:DUF397 domain-containing protein n=1 Tax=unclassified Streptomyces TaxID=2593676 RepID=UPI002259BE33|nr:DUF397 domain-containing protein [Streptomyces sp. NBC_00687]MCX4916415.1 DUF397 domain-containing protein [Streptomyces sp. NBC_00687]
MTLKPSAGDGSELVWFKSSYSDSSNSSECVEVALEWRKSSYSDSSNPSDCVEVATAPPGIHVRDSKRPDDTHLTLAPSTWSAFLTFAAQG